MQGGTLSTSYKKMKTAHFIFSLLLFIVNSIFAQVKDAPVLLFDNGQNKLPVKKIEAVSYQQVIITDQFWKPKIDKNRLIGIRSALNESASSMNNFDIQTFTK